MTFVRAFDQPGNIRDDKRAKITEINHAQVRLERGERIVGNLRPRRRDLRDEGRFPGIGKTDQPHISEQLELELKLELFARTSFLMVARCSVCRSRKARIAKSATSTARRQPALSRVAQINQQVVCARIKNLRAQRNAHDLVAPFAS